MEWLAKRKYFQPSADWRYTVSAAVTPNGIVYTAWRRQRPVACELGNRDNAQACRELCAADAARRGHESAPDQPDPMTDPDEQRFTEDETSYPSSATAARSHDAHVHLDRVTHRSGLVPEESQCP